MAEEKKYTPDEWLQRVQQMESGRGTLKIYIGMSAGVGKTYRMLLEAHQLLKDGVDVRIGYIETHGRKETANLMEGKIYDHTKIQQALTNFFQPDKILQLRELALKEVAGQVERKVDYSITYQKIVPARILFFTL